LRFTVPLTLVITGMLVLLVISYTQVIAAHRRAGGAYAVAKANLGRVRRLLAARRWSSTTCDRRGQLRPERRASPGCSPGLGAPLLAVALIGWRC